MADQADLSQLLSTATQDLFHPDSDLPDIDELFSQVPLPGDLDDYSPATKGAHSLAEPLTVTHCYCGA